MKKQLSKKEGTNFMKRLFNDAGGLKSVKMSVLAILMNLHSFLYAIDLNVSTNPSNCPSSGRLNFSVSNLMPGSPGPIGIPPSVVFHVWSLNPSLTIAGSNTHNSFETAYTTSDLSLGGLSAGDYIVRAVESYGSNVAATPDTPVTIIDGFQETPDFSVNVSDLYCGDKGVITANVTQGTLTEFRLTDATTGAVVRDWQSSNVFSGLPAGSYRVHGRDNCPSPTVAVKGAYVISTRTNNAFTSITARRTECDAYTFSPALRNNDGWLSFPATVTYSIVEDGITVVSNQTVSFNAPSGIAASNQNILDIVYPDYDPAKAYTFTATGQDGCGKSLAWSHSVAANIPFAATLLENCSTFTLQGLTGFVGTVSWEFTTHPAGFTPVTGSSAVASNGFYRTFTGGVPGDYVLKLTDECGNEVEKTFTIPNDCVSACLENEVGVYGNPHFLAGCDGSTILGLSFAWGTSWRQIQGAELISAPAQYGATEFPVNVDQYIRAGGNAFQFPTSVPGSYTFRFTRLSPSCTIPYTFERTFVIPVVTFSDFRISLSPSCGVNSIDYSFVYDSPTAIDGLIRPLVLERKQGDQWVVVTTAFEALRSGTFSNIDQPGTYRVGFQRIVYSGAWGHQPLCPDFDYSNELVVTGSTFPTFTEAYSMACADNPSEKVIVVGGQNGRPWAEGYKYKITHINGDPYVSGAIGYNAAYADYATNEFSQVFNLPDATYTFSLIDVCDNEISREIDVTSLGLPKVRNNTTCENGLTSLKLAVDAFDQISYSWYKVVGAPGGGDDLLMSTSNELVFYPLTEGDAGEYYVRLDLPGLSCQLVDIPYTVEPISNPDAGTTDYGCDGSGKVVYVDAGVPFSLNSLLNGDEQQGGTWTATSPNVSSGWSGSTFTPSQSQTGVFTFAYTVQGISFGECGTVQTASICVKLDVRDSQLPVTLVSFTAVADSEKGARRVKLQ
jgi:hypothetical protein